MAIALLPRRTHAIQRMRPVTLLASTRARSRNNYCLLCLSRADCNGTLRDLRHTWQSPPPPAGYLDDLHLFDPTTMTWTLLPAAEESGTRPCARSGHGFASAGGKLYVHGGVGNTGAGEEEPECLCSCSR
jgi:hypothetical protein